MKKSSFYSFDYRFTRLWNKIPPQNDHNYNAKSGKGGFKLKSLIGPRSSSMNSVASAPRVRIGITRLEILFELVRLLFVYSSNPHALAPRHVVGSGHRRFPRGLEVRFDLLAEASGGGGPQKFAVVVATVAGSGGPHAVTLGQMSGELTGGPGQRHAVVQVVRALRQATDVEVTDPRE